MQMPPKRSNERVFIDKMSYICSVSAGLLTIAEEFAVVEEREE